MYRLIGTDTGSEPVSGLCTRPVHTGWAAREAGRIGWVCGPPSWAHIGNPDPGHHTKDHQKIIYLYLFYYN